MMAFYIWGNEATLMGVLGIFTVLGGSLLYTFVKMSESKATSTPRVAEQKTDVEMQKPVRGQAGTFALTQK
jgi:GDP-fucose transporter C1